jgi:hypothetical protein
VRLQFSFCLPLKLCAWISAIDLLPLPIELFAPAPFSAVKMPTPFESLGGLGFGSPHHLKTRFQK